jgi:prepilin signal peptidase PulO-like enzyme (type II secretory pathway)
MLNFLWLLAVAGFGLAAGVGLNILADDLPPDLAGVRHRPRRPHCRACGQPWPAGQLLALAALGRGCPACGRRRPWRAVAVEVVCALGLPLVWLWAGQGAAGTAHQAVRFAAGTVLGAASVLITVIDLEHRLILWVVVWPTALAVALTQALLPEQGPAKTLWGGLAGYGLFFAVYALAGVYAWVVARIQGRPLDEVAFGGGDVNLAGIVGLAAGWPGVLLALLAAIFAGAAAAAGLIGLQLARRQYRPHTAVAYGPFIVFGGLLVEFFSAQIRAWAQ